MAAAGTDVATIGRILGHRPGSVVTLRYLHTDDDRLRQAAEAVGAAVRARRVPANSPAIGWHTLRHSFATALERRGVDLRTVQDLMRHNTAAMTMRYAHST